jgi:predicted transcriptional regulator
MKSPWTRSRGSTNEEPTRAVTSDRALLISIQPRFANAILDGTKTIELRRTMPTLKPGALALIYSSSPTKAVVGWATVEDVVRATPKALWKKHKRCTGVTSAEFMDYFEGRTNAYGLQLSAVSRAERNLGLAALRKYGLEPPQSWRYITTDLATALRHEMSPPASANASGRFRLHRLLATVPG